MSFRTGVVNLLVFDTLSRQRSDERHKVP
jgi:hypothetical protein